MTEFSYRDATQKDAENLKEIANTYVLEDDMSVTAIGNLIRDRTIQIAELVDDEDGGVVGYVNYRVADGDVIVQHLAVLPDYRDTEVPGELLDTVRGFAEKEGMETRISAREDGWLPELLEGEGFEKTGIVYLDGDELAIFEDLGSRT
ncbi:MAG: GNAT family N-acetyltransferase [Halobacteria archaeon]